MAWNKELESEKIRKKEREVHSLLQYHKNGDKPTPYKKTGYLKEGIMQADFFQWAKNSYIKELGLTLFHVANEGDTGGEAGAIKGAIRFAMGVLAGVPDFICVAAFPQIFFIEFKLPGEKLSEKQVILHEKWRNLGIDIHMVETFDQWEMIIKAILSLIKRNT